MAISTGLRKLLLSNTAITSICKPQKLSNVTYQGVFNEYPVEGFKPPFVLISEIDTDPNVALDGTYGLRFSEFDIDAYSRDYVEAVALGKLIEDQIKDYTGAAGSEDTIKAVIYESRRYDEVFEDQGGDVRQHIISLSFTIQHQPTNGS